MTKNQRAMVKTAFVIGVLAILLAIGFVWPAFLAYAALSAVIGIFIFMIYGIFLMIEDHKEWFRRD